MRKIFSTILIVFCILNQNAWGSKGHAMVAQVAFHYLDYSAKRNVLSYLDGMSI